MHREAGKRILCYTHYCTHTTSTAVKFDMVEEHDDDDKGDDIPLLLLDDAESDGSSYLPTLKMRLGEMASTIRTIWNPPAFAWPKNSALVILDAIEAYRPLFSTNTIAKIQTLIDAAEAMSIPIVMTQWVRVRPTTQASDSIDHKGHWTFYIPSRSQALILKELRVPQNVQKVKVTYTNLFMQRDNWSVPNDAHLVICGSWTESCVINTTRAALDHGHDVTVVSNACGGHAPSSFLALYSIQLCYGQVRQI